MVSTICFSPYFLHAAKHERISSTARVGIYVQLESSVGDISYCKLI